MWGKLNAPRLVHPHSCGLAQLPHSRSEQGKSAGDCLEELRARVFGRFKLQSAAF
jgi:hypothetical protein